MSVEQTFLRQVSLEMGRQKLNQKMLAEKSGVDVQRISRIFIGSTVPRLTDLERFAKALGVTMNSLIENPNAPVLKLATSAVNETLSKAGLE